MPVRVETTKQMPSQPPMKNNTNHSYDSEPIQGRSFKVLQQITEPKSKNKKQEPRDLLLCHLLWLLLKFECCDTFLNLKKQVELNSYTNLPL